MKHNHNDLYSYLKKLNIKYEEIKHAPLFTVQDSQNLRGQINGAHIRNIFLKDKKKKYYLISIEENQNLNLKEIKKLIGASGSLSLSNEEALWQYLGVKPGAVTPFAIINDKNLQVELLLDHQLFSKYNTINAHPLRNDRTISVNPNDLLKFIQFYHKEPKFIDFFSNKFVE